MIIIMLLTLANNLVLILVIITWMNNAGDADDNNILHVADLGKLLQAVLSAAIALKLICLHNKQRYSRYKQCSIDVYRSLVFPLPRQLRSKETKSIEFRDEPSYPKLDNLV